MAALVKQAEKFLKRIKDADKRLFSEGVSYEHMLKSAELMLANALEGVEHKAGKIAKDLKRAANETDQGVEKRAKKAKKSAGDAANKVGKKAAKKAAKKRAAKPAKIAKKPK